MINQQRLVDHFIKYVKISSPTMHEGAFAQQLSTELQNLGFEVTIDDAGEKVGSDTGNLIAKKKGTIKGKTILFSCHMDTVSPSVDVKPIIKDGVIYSDGSTVLGGDDKAGIAAVMEALRTLKDHSLPHADIEIIFSIFEEGGLHGAKNVDISQIEAEEIYVLDSSGLPGQIVIQGPAQDKLEFTVHGKPAHAGVAPEEGISAIMVASEAISQMKLLRIDAETTANIGKFEAGSVTNIITPEAYVLAEARSLDNEKLILQSQHMVDCFKAAAMKYGATVDASVTNMYGAFRIAPDSEIVLKVKKAYSLLGIQASTMSTGGGSDTNIYNSKGLQAVNLGIGERKAHTLEEHLYISDLITVTNVILELIALSIVK
ncbi:MAG: peptidase M20 [Clostridiales bacterium 38-18]|nr:MAG: peptidase M20 [Clostridiales bacterium 38-18]